MFTPILQKLTARQDLTAAEAAAAMAEIMAGRAALCVAGSDILRPHCLDPHGEPSVSATHDPIAFELFKNAIFSIADEMALTIFRTTYSGVLKDNMDYSTAFADAEGRLVAQGLTLPGHLGSIPTALEAVMRRYGEDIREGDVFIMNDPFEGGMHLPDIFIFKPLYHAGERLAFAATICHHTDVGGRVAGSNASDSTEIYAEGLRIPPLKLYEAGRRNEAITWTPTFNSSSRSVATWARAQAVPRATSRSSCNST